MPSAPRFPDAKRLAARTRRWLRQGPPARWRARARELARELDRAIVVQVALVLVVAVLLALSLILPERVAAFFGVEEETMTREASLSARDASRDASLSRMSESPMPDRRAPGARGPAGWGQGQARDPYPASMLVPESLAPSAFAPPHPPFSRLMPTLTLSGEVTAADGRTLRSGPRMVPLAFLRSVPLGEICLDRFLNRAPCEEMSRRALERLVEPVGAQCRAVFYPAGDVRYQCFAGNVDIAGHLTGIGLGWPDAVSRALRSGLAVRPRSACDPGPCPAAAPPGLRSTL